VITGFNTDIEHSGTVYHVQTEDKGLDAPVILSLIYVGGAIIASKRTPYDDLVAAGFKPQVLAERLQRQHKLICAAISAGRIEDLKKMQPPAPPAAAPPKSQPASPAPKSPPKSAPVAAPVAAPVNTPAPVTPPPPVVPAAAAGAQLSGATAAGASDANGAGEKRAGRVVPPVLPAVEAEVVHVEAEQALHLSLLEERDFRAGEVVTIRVRVARGPEEDRVGVANADVTVKILGTEFRPLILRSKTDRDGVANVHAWLPRFTAGRAAVLIRAAADDCVAELRRVIHH
jgi:hypothetical protein